MDKKTWQWQCAIDSDTFLISTDKRLLPLAFVQEAFATEAMFWAKPISDEALRTMLDNSCTLGIYKVDNGDQKIPIGMARMLTDYTTLAYLTDVYLDDSYRNLGLGKWIVRCCREIVMEMKDLRFMVLLTASEQAQNLYRRELGMSLLDGREQPLTCMGARSSKLAEAAGSAPGGPSAVEP
ncbi:acetyltransferase [Paraphoma chrysanthemicola]|uniref:Acetyltransferase n=1 Tax=Paraphoma chrysanthemicola TaxID=798071 RepID=A0A8K0VS90_9PLEO|nr:acetyltransferase [Paraphoma chrysanthemicola]